VRCATRPPAHSLPSHPCLLVVAKILGFSMLEALLPELQNLFLWKAGLSGTAPAEGPRDHPEHTLVGADEISESIMGGF